MKVTQPLVAPDRGRPEDPVAEGVVEVAVGVHDDRDRVAGQLAQVGEDLARLRVGRAGVDDEGLAVAEDHPDVLVVERVAADEDPIADLDPAVADTHRRMLAAAIATPSVAYAAPMPSDRQPRDRRRRHGPARPALAGRRGRGRGAWAGAVGLGPAGPRARRALRPLRARRRPAGARPASTTWAYDHRGKGGSGGRRGDVERWSQLHDDLAERLAAVRARAGRPAASCSTATRSAA